VSGVPAAIRVGCPDVSEIDSITHELLQSHVRLQLGTGSGSWVRLSGSAQAYRNGGGDDDDGTADPSTGGLESNAECLYSYSSRAIPIYVSVYPGSSEL
jgi:hypothetical protein